MCDLRAARLVTSRRGPSGGYRLAREAADTSVGDVLRAVEGPLALVRGVPPDGLEYQGAAKPLLALWLTVCGGFAEFLDQMTLADVAGGAIRLSECLPDLT